MKKKIIIIIITVLFFTLTVNGFNLENQNINKEGAIQIFSEEKLIEVINIPYGFDYNEVGANKESNDQPSRGPSSFFVRDDVYYILDNVNRKVIIKSNNSKILSKSNADNKLSEFPLIDIKWGRDIYVNENGDIYVLDCVSRKVQKYNDGGQFIKSYDVPSSIEIPTALSMDSNNNLIVRQSSKHAAIIDSHNKQLINSRFTGSCFENTSTTVVPEIINDKTGRLTIREIGKNLETLAQHDIDVKYEHGLWTLVVHGIVGNQLVLRKSESPTFTTEILIDTFIEVIDKQGNFQGAARIPLENIIHLPHHFVRTANNKIYFMSVEEEGLKIYEVLVGKNYSKTLYKQIEEYKKQKEEVLFSP